MSDPLPRPFNINALNSADLKKFLEENDIDTYVCKFFSDKSIDGNYFMKVSEETLEKWFPNKVETVNSLMELKRMHQPLPTERMKDKKSTSNHGSPVVMRRTSLNAGKNETSTHCTQRPYSCYTLPQNSSDGYVKKKANQFESIFAPKVSSPQINSAKVDEITSKPEVNLLPPKIQSPQFNSPKVDEITSKPEVNFENVDVSTLRHDEFAEWLRARKIPPEVCEAFRDNEIDGEAFLELEKDDLEKMNIKVGKAMILLKIQKICKKEDTDPPDITPGERQALFHDYLIFLGLIENFPKKLTVKDAMVICKETLGNVAKTDKPEVLPYLILQKIMMFDIKSRSTLYNGEIHDSSTLEKLKEVHPLDNFVTLLHCCNNFLTQDILTRLSTCQLAIPFLLPNPYDKSIMYLLWGMREIIRAWKSSNSSGVLVSNECRIVDYPAPIISFYKIGELQQSKSKIINEVISESSIDFFFNWDCEGGTVKRYFVDGMAELCCYLPSEKQDGNDFYSDILIFANLRGDARKHERQANFMQNISYMSCVLLQEKNLNEEAIKLLEKLSKSPGGVILMFADCSDSENIRKKSFYQQLKGMCIIKLKGKNNAQIRRDIRAEIVKKLSSSTQMHYKKLSECAETAKSMHILIDEDNEYCKDGKKIAEGIMELIKSHDVHEAKLRVLPLQGPNLWQKWATHDKEAHRQLKRNKTVENYDKEMQNKKKAVRQNQFNFTVKNLPAINAFSSNLLIHTGYVRLYFMHWLKMLLDNHSQKELPILSNQYQITRAELLKAKTENKAQQDSKIITQPERKLKEQNEKVVTQLERKLKEQNEKLVNASFGLEHFFREMGQMYEARMDTQLKSVPRDLQDKVSLFPKLMAELISEGYPVELMDGDAAHVPITWVMAVINALKKQYKQNKNIFIISVLGIQSTGKSTLLNTTFGLRFNVSAGRCTRGAYFQILPFNSTMRKETGCDHILIIDTEGLRAPELQYKEQQKHDNELATFVIGLADLTIINIYGETPGEITDILQTAVHAFIRMKNIDMQPSCHFVHQNVTAVMAASKTKIERQNFQDWLDLMTTTAAKVENCEGRFRSFQDVIQFNDETNVTLFPSLWKGDPPTAPVNPGYSFKASTLKEAIIASVKSKESQCTFAAFELRVKSLWNAVLQEKFVFSFKNTMEVTAYNELDTKYSQWSWDLQHKMLEWQHQAGNQINSCDVSDIDSVVNGCLLEIEKDMNNMYYKLKEDLAEFFENNERSETLMQWRPNAEVRLESLSKSHKEDAKKHCKMLYQNRTTRANIVNIQQKYRQQLQTYIMALASDTKKHALTAEEREETFDKQWKEWIDKLSQTIKPLSYATPHEMEMGITEVLTTKYTAYHHVVVTTLKKKPLSKNKILKLTVINDHLEPIRKGIRNLIEDDYCLARAQTDKFFLQVKKWIQEIMETCQDFSKNLVDVSLLANLEKSIQNFNSERQHNFIFTHHYRVDMAITVSGYAYQEFTEKIKYLALESDPVEAMNQLKVIFFRTFETQFSEASNDQTAAQNLCCILKKSVEKALIQKLQIEIVENMRLESCSFRKKNYFRVLVMKDLAVKKDFELYKVYITDIAASLKYWSNMYVKQYCERQLKNGNTNLFDLAKDSLKILTDEIIKSKGISNFTESCSDTASHSSYKNLSSPGDSSQHCDIKKWLESFYEHAKRIIVIDLQEIMDVIGVRSIHNISFFTKQVIKYLKHESEAILSDFKNTKASIERLTESANSPHLVLYNSLIGCKEQCPFCKEQCELTDENHLDLGKAHYTEIHRPNCLGGCTYENKKMVIETCTQNIETKLCFKNSDTSNKPYPFKDYKTIYPNWLISTESPKTAPKYWEWFIAKYNAELVEWNKAIPTSIEEQGWPDITEEDAIDNLSITYGLNIQPN